jgi:sec-independent protein translocase protein TatA
MLGNAFTGWHLLVVLAVILLLFGAAKLPALAKSLGQSARVFRGEIKEMKKENSTDGDTSASDLPQTRSASNVASDSGTSEPKP